MLSVLVTQSVRLKNVLVPTLIFLNDVLVLKNTYVFEVLADFVNNIP